MTNEIFNKTQKDKYIAVNDKTLNKLMKLADLKIWHLYFILAKKQSLQNALCGIFEELSLYDLMKDLNNQLNINLNTQKILRLLNKLQKENLVRVINQKPFIALLTSAEQAEDLKNLSEVLDYVKHNEKEFNFHIMHKRANKFYEFFRIQRIAQIIKTDDKAQALDDIVKSRLTRQVVSSDELSKALEWSKLIDEDEDPFFSHLSNNNNLIKKEKNAEYKFDN